ncbi:uncharacterized protein LOC135133157 [Zophobas morio]|uniref:uncharacterized protein LOC135133157 n=1 Tax=Zophobas morio TaxID=2755281 RepID=UPI003083B373
MSDDCCCDSGGGGDSGGACDSGGNCDSGEPYDSGGHCGSGGNNDTVFNPADVPSYTAFDVSNSTTNGYFYNHDNDNSQNNTNSFGTGQETDMCNKCRAAPPNRKFPAHTSQNPSTFYTSIVQTTSKVLPNRTLANRRLLLPLPISQVSVEIHNHLDENQELSTTTTCERPQTVQKSAQQPKKILSHHHLATQPPGAK